MRIIISICIPTYNRLPFLKKLLDSFSDGFGGYPYEIVIADGGSTDGTLEYLRKREDVKLIEQGKLTGAVKACNTCLKIAQGKYAILVSDDMTIVPEVIKKSCELMDKEEKISLVMPKAYEPEFGHLHRVSLAERYYWLLYGKSFLFRTSALKEMNYIDETYRTYSLESDSAFSILKLGYTIIFTKEIGINHYRAEDIEKNKARNVNKDNKTLDKERKYFDKKWGSLMAEVENYIKNDPSKKRKALFYRRLIATMFYAKWLRPFLKISKKGSMKMYDWIMDRSLIFKDEKYRHMKNFVLAQKLPDEILSAIN